MSRGYGKYRRGGGAHSSFHFDSIFKENANKPSAARSAATVGKWGITSFTSIRTANGAPRPAPPVEKPAPESALPKPKKFFKSRNKSAPAENQSAESEARAPKRPREEPRRRFFAPKAAPAVLGANASTPDKPPIVLRICRGRSQLLNDSDESDEGPPAARSEPRSPSCRVTRAARRSMQDAESPDTDAVGEFALFDSPPKDERPSDASPQYIPAERYELERRAVYEHLLKPSTPPEPAPAVESAIQSDAELIKLLSGGGEPLAVVGQEAKIEDEWGTDSDSAPATPPPVLELAEGGAQGGAAADALPPKLEEEVEDEEEEEEDEGADGKMATAAPAESEGGPLVKLLISKKKGSIFKSRSLVNDGTKKRRALYKHKWCDDKEAAAKTGELVSTTVATSSVYDEFGFNDDPLTVVKKESDGDEEEAATSIKCTRNDKGFYTVVRNVKKAHQIQEIGEFQEFNDDVEYILDALQDNNPISTRCLSAITLASKCMAPAFRMHVRAHGTVAKFFKALHDATRDQSLGLCTATVMFVLSQDRLNMDLDRDCLELMLNLLESDVGYQQALDVCGLSSAQLEKNKQKVRELCGEIQSQGHAMHLNLENITVGQLAMETLLSLTSKRAGEWFKEELRELGGLEHIMKTICECCRQVSDYVVSWTDALLDKLRKVDRCLRVLENVSHNNEENQTYLLNYNQGVILDTLVNLYKLCDGEIPLYPVTDIADKESTGTIIREALLVTLKVLINLTHHFKKQSMGSTLIGSRLGIIETSLHLLLQVPHYIPEQKKFELGVLVLMLLINLIQDNNVNQKLLVEARAPSKSESIYSRDESAVEALIAQFYHWEGCAKIAEKRTNAILDGEKEEENAVAAPVPKSNEEFIEETVAKLLQKAGTHMEYTFLASYIVMLIGFLIMENSDFQVIVRQYLKGNDFADMVELLKKFFNFMNLTASTEASSVCAIKTTEKVIKYLEECDKPSIASTSQDKPNYSGCVDLSYTMAH